MVKVKKGDILEWISRGTKRKPIEKRRNRILKVTKNDIYLIFPQGKNIKPAIGSIKKRFALRIIKKKT